MLQEADCKTTLHIKISGQDRIILLPVNGKESWVIMAPTEARSPKSAYFYPFLPKEVLKQGEGFVGLPSSEYTLEMWAGVFQILQ